MQMPSNNFVSHTVSPTNTYEKVEGDTATLAKEWKFHGQTDDIESSDKIHEPRYKKANCRGLKVPMLEWKLEKNPKKTSRSSSPILTQAIPNIQRAISYSSSTSGLSNSTSASPTQSSGFLQQQLPLQQSQHQNYNFSQTIQDTTPTTPQDDKDMRSLVDMIQQLLHQNNCLNQENQYLKQQVSDVQLQNAELLKILMQQMQDSSSHPCI